MAGHRYRVNKIKRMHSIVHGLLPILEDMARHPAIAQITPGRISGDRHADDYNVTMQYFTESGMKLIARTPTAVQEVFIVTSEPEKVQAWLVSEGLIEAPRRNNDAQRDEPSATAAKTKLKTKDASGGKSAGRQRTEANRNHPQSGARSRSGRNARRATIADKYGHEPTGILTDLPTDSLLFSDYLNAGAAAKLRRLRNQIAAQEAPDPPKPHSSSGQAAVKGAAEQSKRTRQKATSQGKGMQTNQRGKPRDVTKAYAPTTKGAKPRKADNQPTKTSKKETNLLEAWLKQADDETFKRLSRKFKGSEK